LGKEIQAPLVSHKEKSLELEIFFITCCSAQKSFHGNWIVNPKLSVALSEACLICTPKTNYSVF